MDINKITQAIEADAGVKLEGLRQSLKEMETGQQGRTYTPEQQLVREVRGLVGYSQPEFAKVIRTSVTSLRDWEQGRHTPPGVVSTLMNLIKMHPELIHDIEAIRMN